MSNKSQLSFFYSNGVFLPKFCCFSSGFYLANWKNSFIGTFVLLISFILAFKLRKKNNLPVYFKFFYCVPLMAVLVTINGLIGVYFKKFTDPVFFTFQHFFYFLEFLITCLVFYKIFKQKRLFYIVVFSITITFLSLFLLNSEFNKVLLQLYAILSLAIFALCINYYYSLFEEDEKPVLDLLKSPSFWIVTGLFFFSAISLPLFAVQEYFSNRFGHILGNYILSSINLFVIVKHIFFIKACRCVGGMNVESC